MDIEDTLPLHLQDNIDFCCSLFRGKRICKTVSLVHLQAPDDQRQQPDERRGLRAGLAGRDRGGVPGVDGEHHRLLGLQGAQQVMVWGNLLD